MKYTDILEFDDSFTERSNYGFSEFFVVGKDVFEYGGFSKGVKHPAIMKSDDVELILNSLAFFDIIYFTRYETNVELISAVSRKGKVFLISLADVLERKGISRAVMMYRISRFLQFCRSYKADFIICSRAKNAIGLRDVDEIVEICKILGLEAEETRGALYRLPSYIEATD